MKRNVCLILVVIIGLFSFAAIAEEHEVLYPIAGYDTVNTVAGYANAKGEVVIPCSWFDVDYFSGEYAEVDELIAKYDIMVQTQSYIIDRSGEIIFPNLNVQDVFYNGLALTEMNDGYGFINEAGDFVIPPKYKKAESFEDGYALVSIDGDNYGVIDVEGNIVIPFRLNSGARYAGNGLFVSKIDGSELEGIINTSNEIVVPCEWDIYYSFNDGLCAVKKNDKFGFINTKGELVIPCEYEDVSSFSEGLAAVKQYGLYGYIDTTGQMVIPATWEEAKSFSEGLAMVMDYKNGLCGFIDTEGNLVIPCKWTKPSIWSPGVPGIFKNGLSLVADGSRLYYIDRNGEKVLDAGIDTDRYHELGDSYTMKESGNRLIGSVTASTEEIPETEIQDVVETTYSLLSKGSKGEEVKKLQTRLNAFGYSVGTADGDYGNKTLNAIEQFQSDNELEVTGIADSHTQELLFESYINPIHAKAGITLISDMAIEEASKLWGVSASSCSIGDVICLDKGDLTYHFAARVYYGTQGGIGFGRDISFENNNGTWNALLGNEIKIYSKVDEISGEIISGNSTYQASEVTYDKAASSVRTQEECQEIAIAYMKEHIHSYLKNPASLQIISVTGGKTEGNEYLFSINFTAMNSFGGYTPGSYYCTVDYTTGEVTMGGMV